MNSLSSSPQPCGTGPQPRGTDAPIEADDAAVLVPIGKRYSTILALQEVGYAVELADLFSAQLEDHGVTAEVRARLRALPDELNPLERRYLQLLQAQMAISQHLEVQSNLVSRINLVQEKLMAQVGRAHDRLSYARGESYQLCGAVYSAGKAVYRQDKTRYSDFCYQYMKAKKSSAPEDPEKAAQRKAEAEKKAADRAAKLAEARAARAAAKEAERLAKKAGPKAAVPAGEGRATESPSVPDAVSGAALPHVPPVSPPAAPPAQVSSASEAAPG